MCERNPIRAPRFIPRLLKGDNKRRTRLRRKHKTHWSATTNDLAVSCARQAALSFLLLFSSFTSQRECALKENHKRIHQQSEARERKSEICNQRIEFAWRCALRVELDHALFAFSIQLMTAASSSASEFIRTRSEKFVIEATSSALRPECFEKLRKLASIGIHWWMN